MSLVNFENPSMLVTPGDGSTGYRADRKFFLGGKSMGSLGMQNSE
jgi:hypothetical protein